MYGESIYLAGLNELWFQANTYNIEHFWLCDWRGSEFRNQAQTALVTQANNRTRPRRVLQVLATAEPSEFAIFLIQPGVPPALPGRQ